MNNAAQGHEPSNHFLLNSPLLTYRIALKWVVMVSMASPTVTTWSATATWITMAPVTFTTSASWGAPFEVPTIADTHAAVLTPVILMPTVEFSCTSFCRTARALSSITSGHFCSILQQLWRVSLKTPQKTFHKSEQTRKTGLKMT